MSTLPTTLKTARRPYMAVPWVRWCALVLLLAGEVVFITTRFESDALAPILGDWAKFAWAMPQLMRLAAVIVATCALVGGRKLLAAMHDELATAHVRSRLSLLMAHLASFGVFTWVTKQILEPGSTINGLHPMWLVIWCASAVAVGAAWALSLWPGSVWRRLAWHGRWGLVAGALAGVAVWSAGLLAQRIWRPLAAGTLWGVHGLLRMVFSDCVLEPDDFVVGTSSFAVEIAPACSGYEGIGLITAFVAVFLWVDRSQLRFPNALALFPIAVLAAWLGNIIRIALLVALGSTWSPSVARGGFHSQAGWIAFVAIALAIVASAGRFAFFSRALTAQTSTTRNPAIPYLVPLLVVTGVGMLTGAFAEGVDLLYPLRVVAALAALWWFRARYRALNWNFSWWSICAGLATFVLWQLLAPSVEPAAESTSKLAGLTTVWREAWWFVRALGFLLIAPLVEELAFRGFLTRFLIDRDFEAVSLMKFTCWSLVISSAAFGALHGRCWLAGVMAGGIYQLVVYRRGSLADAIASHATTNVCLLIHSCSIGRLSGMVLLAHDDRFLGRFTFI